MDKSGNRNRGDYGDYIASALKTEGGHLSIGRGFVTIWQSGRIVWQGDEENIPARFPQQELDL